LVATPHAPAAHAKNSNAAAAETLHPFSAKQRDLIQATPLSPEEPSLAGRREPG
jgi:hypothetical protein